MDRATNNKKQTGIQGMNKFRLSLLTLAMAGVGSLACSAVAQTAQQAPQSANQQAAEDNAASQQALDSVEVIQV
ncbi:hypothetical protein R0J87_22260, partial [Halomonas sp. SIMBA_159]